MDGEPTQNELKILNRERLKKFNDVLSFMKKDSKLIYPDDFYTYDDKPAKEQIQNAYKARRNN